MPQTLYPLERHPSTHPLLMRLSELRNRSGVVAKGMRLYSAPPLSILDLLPLPTYVTFFLKFPQPLSRSSLHFALRSRSQHPLQGYDFNVVNCEWADPSGRTVQGVGLRPLAQLDCGSEFRQGYGCLTAVVVCCQVRSGWSLVQRNRTECGVSVIVKSG
jgi:hypothetical protein